MKIFLKSFLIMTFIMLIFSSCATKRVDIDIDKDCTAIDNSYNNYISGGDLCMIDNSLIYNSCISNFNHGYYEIKDGKSTRFYWTGPILIPCEPTTGFYFHNNSFYFSDTNNIESYSFKFREITKTEIGTDGHYQFVDDYLYFLKADSNSCYNNLYRIKQTDVDPNLKKENADEKCELILENIDCYVIYENKIFYSKNIAHNKYGLYVFSFGENTTEECVIIEDSIHSFYIFNCGLIAKTNNAIYWWDKNNNRMESIWGNTNILDGILINAYGSQIYGYSNATGLFEYNVLTHQQQIISSEVMKDFSEYDGVSAIYIVDDKYIYLNLYSDTINSKHAFIKSELVSNLLIRIDKAGNIERVFPVD